MMIRFACILLASLLAACSASPTPELAVAPDASASSAPSAGSRADEGRPSGNGGGLRAPSRVDLDPDQLINTEQADVSSLLGRPGYERHEQNAKVWQYRSGRCVLDVFLYREDGRWRVAYLEFRSPDVGPVSPADCFEMLVRENAETRES